MAKEIETNPSVIKKKHLERVLRCSRCRPHRGENVGRWVKRGVKKSRRKNKRRL